jgi:hypothetical protein
MGITKNIHAHSHKEISARDPKFGETSSDLLLGAVNVDVSQKKTF